MKSTDNFLNWLISRIGKVTYSMAKRNGPSSYDCSSAMYYALNAGGFWPEATAIGNTDSLFNDLERNGWSRISANKQGNYDTKRGDIVIWGKRGASGGAAGHVMAFINPYDVVHCNSYYNGIHIDNYDGLARANGWPEATFYRYTGAAYTPPSIKGSPTDQVLEIGSTIKFTKTYTANEVKLLGGIWQVRCDVLCPKGFTWNDNGIPAAPLVEVDAAGYATADQDLTTSPRLFKLPGKFTVLDLGETNGVWMALISSNGLKFWVDVATATEIKSTDAGTPTPGKKPTTPTKPSAPAPAPAKSTEPTPSGPPKETPDKPAKSEDNQPVVPAQQPPEKTPSPLQSNNPKEDKTMAFSDEDQKKLQKATDEAQKTAEAVADVDAIKSIVSGVSKRTKLAVYIFGDALIGLGIVTPNLAIVLGWSDVVRVVAASSLFTMAGTFTLTMFGIYKSKS